MLRGKEPVQSSCERNFILEAIKERKRLDGRSLYDYRNISVSLSKLSPGNVTVHLGYTKVQACVSCEVIKPRPQNPTNGQLQFNVNPSPMASPSYEINKSTWLSVKIERLLEKCFRDSRALDTESLCIIASSKVWSIRVDVHILNNDGNVIDCCVMAVLVALKHFRRPDVSVNGEEAIIYPVTEREPVPLNIHHMPLCVNIGFYHSGEYLLVDPSFEEEQVLNGQMLIVMNIHSEICTMQMTGGVALSSEQVMRCVKIALVKVNEINNELQSVLKRHRKNTDKGTSILTTRQEESSHVVDLSKLNIGEGETSNIEPDVVILGRGAGEVVQSPTNEEEMKKVLEGMTDPPLTWEGNDDSEEESTDIVSHKELGGFVRKQTKLNGSEDASDKGKLTTKKPRKRKKKI